MVLTHKHKSYHATLNRISSIHSFIPYLTSKTNWDRTGKKKSERRNDPQKSSWLVNSVVDISKMYSVSYGMLTKRLPWSKCIRKPIFLDGVLFYRQYFSRRWSKKQKICWAKILRHTIQSSGLFKIKPKTNKILILYIQLKKKRMK